MPNITADKIIGQDIYSKGSVQALNSTFKPGKIFSKGQKIGNVYSYIESNDGALYWMIYETPRDFANFNPIYVKHITGMIEAPALPGILAELERKKKAEELEKLGPVAFYVKKYLPYIVGAIALAILIPAVRKR
jgi:hypothetical protein